jgi:hypothetical protein
MGLEVLRPRTFGTHLRAPPSYWQCLDRLARCSPYRCFGSRAAAKIAAMKTHGRDGLLPEGFDNRVVIAKHQRKTVWILFGTPDAVGRLDHAHYLRKILFANTALLFRLCLVR